MGELGGDSKSTGTGMDDGMGFIVYTLTIFSAKVPIQVSAFRFHHHQNSFLESSYPQNSKIGNYLNVIVRESPFDRSR